MWWRVSPYAIRVEDGLVRVWMRERELVGVYEGGMEQEAEGVLRGVSGLCGCRTRTYEGVVVWGRDGLLLEVSDVMGRYAGHGRVWVQQA